MGASRHVEDVDLEEPTHRETVSIYRDSQYARGSQYLPCDLGSLSLDEEAAQTNWNHYAARITPESSVGRCPKVPRLLWKTQLRVFFTVSMPEPDDASVPVSAKR